MMSPSPVQFRIERGLKAKGGLSEKLFRKAVALGLKKLDGGRLSLAEKITDSCPYDYFNTHEPEEWSTVLKRALAFHLRAR